MKNLPRKNRRNNDNRKIAEVALLKKNHEDYIRKSIAMKKMQRQENEEEYGITRNRVCRRKIKEKKEEMTTSKN